MIDEALWNRVTLSRWKVTLLRVIFPRRWWVQIGQKVYFLRMPPGVD